MNRKKLIWGLMVVSLALSASADSFQFNSIARSVIPTSTNFSLNAVSYDGNSSFLAVGQPKFYAYGNFLAGQVFPSTNDWAAGQIPQIGNLGLFGVAYGVGQFVATGDSNVVFTASGASNSTTLAWVTTYHNIFGNAARAPGIAYNGTNFLAVGEAPEISFSGTNLPVASDWNPVKDEQGGYNIDESFRGVTTYGSNGFAICGLYGDVRISTNGTTSHVIFSGVNEPDFNGIAYDGNNAIVCVGAAASSSSGVIVFSNSASGAWQQAYINSSNATPLNAVAYTGSGFIAVGNQGQILTSPNGSSWTNAVSPTTQNLYGVTFATNGYMQGVGEIVGTNTVILFGLPPPTNNPVGNAWICDGLFPNPIFVGTNTMLPSNTLEVTNISPTNIVTVDWFPNPTNNVPATNYLGEPATNSFSFTPESVTGNTGNYTNFYYAQARDFRTGFVSTNRTEEVLTNFMRPTATLVTTQSICNGGSAVLQVALAGNGPWTVTWTDGINNYVMTNIGPTGYFPPASPFTTNLIVPNAVFDPTNSLPNSPITTNYWVSRLSDAYFPADDPGNTNLTAFTNWSGDLSCTNMVVIYPRPTAIVSNTTNTIANGQSTAISASLTGTGPNWYVTWSKTWATGSSNILVTYSSMNVTLVDSPTNALPNAPTNYTYSIVALSDSSPPDCGANPGGLYPGDLQGSARVIVDPLPTATLLSYNSTNCNDGSAATLTNILTGIGPWTIYWNDGTSQSLAGLQGPTNLLRTVYPTNSFGANVVSNNVYYVTNVAETNSFNANPSGISGVVTNAVNPRPTSKTGAAGTKVVCNSDNTITLTNVLTGFGPWIVYWTDGSGTYPQSVSVSKPGPYTNTLTLPVGSLNPTNIYPNSPTNYSYWVSLVTDSNMCSSEAIDLAGTNQVVVNPVGTVPTNGFVVATNDFAAVGIGTNGSSTSVEYITLQTAGSPYSITMDNWGGSGSNYLYVTNHFTYSGLLPWTMVLSEVGANFQGTGLVTNYFTNNFDAYSGIIVITNLITRGTAGTNFTISIYDLGTNGCANVLATNTVVYAINNTPSVNVNLAGQSAAQTTVCSDNPATNVVDLVGGVGDWIITWNDGVSQTNLNGTTTLYRPIAIDNTGVIPVTNLYWVTNLVVTNLYGALIDRNLASNEVGFVEIIVDPVYDLPSEDVYSCYNVAVPLSVNPPAGFAVDWFSTATTNTPFLIGTNTYMPPIPSNVSSNTTVTNTYYLKTRYLDPGLTNCYSAPTSVLLISEPCTNAISSIIPTGTTAVITWSGNYVLQSATNLNPPVWVTVTNGGFGTNSWTNSIVPPPANSFFRLFAPTN